MQPTSSGEHQIPTIRPSVKKLDQSESPKPVPLEMPDPQSGRGNRGIASPRGEKGSFLPTEGSRSAKRKKIMAIAEQVRGRENFNGNTPLVIPSVSDKEAQRILRSSYTTTISIINDINVDVGYQRSVDINKCVRISEAFNHDVCGEIDVNRRPDGTLWAIDGQHRMIAAIADGEEMIRTHIYQFQSRELEAIFFTIKNSNTNSAGALARLKSRITAGDADAIALRDAIEKYGFEIAFKEGHKALNPTGISAIATIESIVRSAGGLSRLDNTLYVIREAWYGKPDSTSALIFAGIEGVLRKYPTISLNELIKKLRQNNPSDLKIKADSLRRLGGLSIGEAVVNVIEQAYDFHRTTGRLRPKVVAEK